MTAPRYIMLQIPDPHGPSPGTIADMTALRERVNFDLGSLVQEHQADVWRYLRYLGASSDDADDLTQETFLAIARAPFELRTRAETSAYLRTAARNQLLMLRRRQGRRISTVELASAEQVWSEEIDQGRSSQFVDALEDCVAALEGRAAEAVQRFYGHNQGRQEIATVLGIQVEGVKTLLRRTRAALRDCVERKLQKSPS